MDICKYKELYHDEIVSIIECQKVCKLGTTNNASVTIVPMYYVYACEDNSPVFYLISMEYGDKMEDMEETGLACIYIDRTRRAGRCSFTESVVANGFASFVDNPTEKEYIMKRFIDKYHRPITCCDDVCLVFIKITVSKISGRCY
ncbi:MAG: pyridoxamine 5'-phosphate oxidase family protein [Clostridium sp.]